MTTLQEAQRWLRQKKASGRLSPTEEQQAYQAYFSTEAGNLNDRARIEQQAQRDAVTKSQGAERLAQEGRKVALYEQEAKDKADALETQGRLQLAKIAVPDLFMEGGGNGGGAQGETQSALGTSQIGSRESGRAVDSLSTETYSPNAFAPESKSYSMQSVTGKTLGGMFTNTIGTKGQNAKAAAIAGKEGVIAGWGLRGADEIM